MPAFGVVDGVQGASVEMAHTAPYYFFGKDPTFALDCAIPFGLNSRQMTAWMWEGNGLEADARLLQELQHRQLPDGQHRRPDGRLVPQGDQVAGRHQGPEDAHRRLRRQGARAHRRGAAEHPRRRDLLGAREGHHRRRRVGRPLRRPQARLQQGRAELLLPRLVGRRPAADAVRQQQRPTRACRPSTRPSSRAPRPTPTSMQAALRRAQPGGAEDAGRPGHRCSASRRT